MIVIFYDFVLLTHYEYFYGGVNWLDKKILAYRRIIFMNYPKEKIVRANYNLFTCGLAEI